MGTIRKIDEESYSAVARFMSEIKPEWWDYEGAYQQLQDNTMLARLVGWHLSDDSKIEGWILCAEYDGYSVLSIENLGYDDNGQFIIDDHVEPLLRKAEEHAISRGYRCLKFITGSTGLWCHGKSIRDFATELKTLTSHERKDYDYFLTYGFVPTGFIPNCYGNGFHGIVLIKLLV